MDTDRDDGMFSELMEMKKEQKRAVDRDKYELEEMIKRSQQYMEAGQVTRSVPRIVSVADAGVYVAVPQDDVRDDFKSGAKSSGKMPRFDLIPRTFLQRIAARFKIGADKYPPFNYRKGFADKEYVLDRINHLQNHLQAFLNPQTIEEFTDDNLAGIGWAVAFLMECQTTLEGRNSINEIVAERSKHIIKHPKTDGLDFIE